MSTVTVTPITYPVEVNIVTGAYLPLAGGQMTGDLLYDDSRGYLNNLNKMTSSLSELATNTLLDKSRSTLSCSGSVLTYTLIAVDGSGTWNFDGKVYPQAVASASIPLIAGTNTVPVVNHIYFELVANVPTLAVSDVEPETTHINVATFIVGAVSGASYTVYGYDRNREETETFVHRTIDRLETVGTVYESGFVPTVTNTALSVASGEYFCGIFEMFTSTTVAASGGYFFINSAGQFIQSTDLHDMNVYADGSAVAANERQNIVWGIVATTTTSGGETATTPKLVAVLQSKPGVTYTTDVLARQDLYEATNYFPPNTTLKKVFLPIARTILRPSTGQFTTFDGGLYWKDLRGRVTSGGGAAQPTDTSGLVPYTGATSDVNLGSYSLNSDLGKPTVTSHGTIGIHRNTSTVSPSETLLFSTLHLGSSGNYDLAVASSSDAMPCSALATAASSGTKKVLISGIARDDSWTWTIGGLLYVDRTTPGLLTQTAPSCDGDLVQVVGLAISDTIIHFNPNYGMVEV